jgi:hypothetical protein
MRFRGSIAGIAKTKVGRELGKLSRKSDTSMELRYALGRWEALTGGHDIISKTHAMRVSVHGPRRFHGIWIAV